MINLWLLVLNRDIKALKELSQQFVFDLAKPNQFLGDKADPYLIDKLTTDSELSGLLGMVVKRIPKVLAKGIYVPTSSIGENYTKYIQNSNPVRAFVETAIVQDRTVSISIPKEDVYVAYKRFCNEKKLACESDQSFSRKLVIIINNVLAGKNYDPAIRNTYTFKSMGIDPAYGSSNFGILITQFVGVIQVLYADEFPRPDYNEMLQRCIGLIENYNVTKVYIDGANPSFIRSN